MNFIKSLIPESLLKALRPFYHGLVAVLGGWYFGNPSSRLVVIGVTGTAGKSTTVQMLARILNSPGTTLGTGRCGFITTVSFFDGKTEYINKHGLSMPGGWMLQKQLKQMLVNGCRFAVIECTSEGLAQNRHLGINFDMAVFTNLAHAHLEAHGSFGNYQAAKALLFLALQKSEKKSFFGKKIIGVNSDDPMSGYFLSFPADVKFGLTFRHVQIPGAHKNFFANLLSGGPPIKFEMNGQQFVLNLLGEFNAKNAALAAACAEALGVSLEQSAEVFKNFNGVRGRMENVPSLFGFKVIVDYGCEPVSIQAALESASQLPHNRLIHVFGSTGGHRDVSKRFVFGKISAQYADEIIITNDDVYDSSPEEIARNIEEGVKSFQLRKPPYQIILDRRAAINKAIAMAKKDDIVLITGKGSEQFLVLPGNRRVPWDEVEIVREELNKIDQK